MSILTRQVRDFYYGMYYVRVLPLNSIIYPPRIENTGHFPSAIRTDLTDTNQIKMFIDLLLE